MQGGKDSPNLTPLLDVVLQLIMFFMITVNFVRVDQLNEEVRLPSAQAAVPMDQAAEDWVFLNMNKDGKLVGSNIHYDLDTPGKIRRHMEQERDRLKEEFRSKGYTGEPKIVVVLRADKDARYADVWQVLDNCNKAGYRRWQLRVMTRPA